MAMDERQRMEIRRDETEKRSYVLAVPSLLFLHGLAHRELVLLGDRAASVGDLHDRGSLYGCDLDRGRGLDVSHGRREMKMAHPGARAACLCAFAGITFVELRDLGWIGREEGDGVKAGDTGKVADAFRDAGERRACAAAIGAGEYEDALEKLDREIVHLWGDLRPGELCR